MTCIAAIGNSQTGRSWMAGDSFCRRNNLMYISRDPKIFKKTGNGDTWLFGVSGVSRYNQVVQYEVGLPEIKVPDREEDRVGFIFEKWIPLLREAVHREGATMVKDGMDNTESVILIALRGALY